MLSAAELGIVQTCADVVSILSVMGSAAILLAYLRYTSLRKFSFTLVAFLSVSDLFNHLFDMVGPKAEELEAQRLGAPISDACWVQAFGNAVFELSSILWTGAIALTLYEAVWLGWRAERIEAQFYRLAGVCFCVPVFLFVLPLLVTGPSVIGPSGGSWCWIRPQFGGWIFGLFYVPLWLVMIFNGVVHFRTSRRLTALIEGKGGVATDPVMASRLLLVLQRLKFYPFILFVVWFPASVSRVVEAANGGRSIFGLVLFHRIFSSSQGFLNAIAYGLSRGVREAIVADLARIFPCCCATRHIELSSVELAEVAPAPST